MFQPPRTVLEIGEGGGMDLLSSWKEERYYFIALLLLVHKYKKKKKAFFVCAGNIQEVHTKDTKETETERKAEVKHSEALRRAGRRRQEAGSGDICMQH